MQYSNLAMRMFCSTYGRRCLSATNRHRLRFSESVSPTYRFLRAHGKPQISGQYLAGFKSSRVKAMAGADEDLLTTLKARGLFDNCTDESGLRDALQLPIKIYCGFDPTADSLHLGNLLGIIILSWFQRAGHQPVILVGGATGSVGDPSGRSQERPLLDEKTLSANVSAICDSIESILKRNGGHGDTTVLNNYDWFKDISLLGFLRDTGKFARLGTMLSKDSVRKRLESEDGLSFTEFTYQLLQGYDFHKLNIDYNCILQMGGSDQWGNIICGIDLSRRLAGKELYGLTTPLLTTSSGQKMGKTEDGAIWLNFISDKDNYSTHPRDFWNYWRDKTENNDVGKFLKLFTDMPLNEIDEIEKLENEDIEKGKELLATKITELVHGKDSDWKSKKTIILKKEDFENGYGLLSLLSNDDLGLAKSNSEARRFIQSKAVKLNGELIDDEKYTLTLGSFKKSKEIEISLGKKKKIIIGID